MKECYCDSNLSVSFLQHKVTSKEFHRLLFFQKQNVKRLIIARSTSKPLATVYICSCYRTIQSALSNTFPEFTHSFQLIWQDA